MLVLTRKLCEKIMIGRDIVVTIVRIEEHQVRVGIDAPKDVKVHRLEVYEDDERRAALEKP